MERMFTNEETRLDLLAPYADYSVTLKPARYSSGFGRVIDDHITVHFHVRTVLTKVFKILWIC